MDIEDSAAIRKRAYAALAAALLGWLLHVIKQAWTPNAILGTFAELFYWLYIYLLMPFAFAGLLLAITAYVVNRVRGYYDRDIVFVLLSVIALALAFWVTAPVIGEIGIAKATAVFFVFRLIKRFW